MNAPYIKFETPGGIHQIPNRWELLSPELYPSLCRLLSEYNRGGISFRELHIDYVCLALGLNPRKIKEPASTNIYLLSEQIDFIFSPDGKLNACFLAQLVPVLPIEKKEYPGYTINKACDTLTSSLTALQFIEAYELIGYQADKLPLLAAILYCPGKYTSESAHLFADELRTADENILQAIALNFNALVNFLFTKTHFSILMNKKPSEKKNITISMADGLYNLSADGLGDASAIEQLPLLKYLSILRKKLIESVQAMHQAEMDLQEIATKTGLSIKTIKKII